MNKRPLLKLKIVSKPAPTAAEAPKLRPSYHPDVKPVLQPGFQPDLRADSLAFCLLGAANAVAQVRTGTALPQALTRVFAQNHAAPQARGAIQDISYRAMRQLGRSETLIGLMTSKAPEPPMLAALLCCALALMAAEPGEQPYEEFTVVDQAVTVATSHPDMAHAKGMVNAVLRRFLRERKALLASALQQPVAQWNYPQWWIDAARAAYPRDWQAILTAGNAAPPLTLRVNARKSTVADYLAQLAGAGIAAAQVGPSAVRLAQPIGVQAIPGFAAGVVSVQDAGAQLAAGLLDVRDGMRVLDACAAPGGKTCHILELADVELTAIDADAKRLPRIAENLERLGLSATLQAQDAQSAAWWDGRQFDRVLADVPCTASGIVRRHPDIRWLRRKGDALQLATLSAKILDNLWQMVRPDGKLLFVTCSLWPQESEAQAAAFAVRHNATRLPAPGQLLPTGAAEQDHDGLFYALFQKNAA
ncbi:16S rRNA (cytosine(967)-C(5))-methyltransferase RsmB [Janthinobacterium fluminis]|uniref:16S rRNA (Cytosine(967)-C(5))-methyltransferase RsmB n=1 Tax=Janthinobacterium fluminis TaxID=2987524 RepID=A0ABT5K6J5_9BURK|nr:16S rRNA (cytosine(967)-C(5))-methyltransferase RsmB [Janthinobacterium fluminis]MDC8760622.1 16S rRNA (cytosine(967)-C(5))-methyltransferase RsmB [Janthinobacterium fluminis]